VKIDGISLVEKNRHSTPTTGVCSYVLQIQDLWQFRAYLLQPKDLRDFAVSMFS